jgi:glutathionyl-hydroquinone reductase
MALNDDKNNNEPSSNPQQLPERLDRGMNFLAISPIPQGRIVTAVAESWKFLWKRFMAELAPQDETGAYRRPSYVTTMSSSSSSAAATRLLLRDDNTPGRYRLYTGNPCPWCHRVLLAYRYLQLQDRVSHVTLLDNPRKASRGGWILREKDEHGHVDLKQVYDYYNVAPGVRCTAPLLVDTIDRVFVSNESADILRLLYTLAVADDDDDEGNDSLYPVALRTEIDEMNEWIYRLVNNGVYRCGFCTTQGAYDVASRDVRVGLDRCEAILSKPNAHYLLGRRFTEADVRLLPTLLRFDGVYAPLFRAGGAHLRLQSNYPALHRYLRRCWTNLPAVRESIDLADACGSYYRQLFPLNPSGIVPTPVSARDLGLSDDDDDDDDD